MAITYFGGNSDTGNVGLSSDTPWGAAYTAPVTGNITTARVKAATGSTPSTHPSKFLIYANSGGNPGALLGASDELVLANSLSSALRTYTFSVPVAVVSGTSYFLVAFSGPSDITVRYQSVAGGSRIRSSPSSYGSGPPSPFGTASSSNFQPYVEAGIDDAPLTAAFVPRIAIIG